METKVPKAKNARLSWSNQDRVLCPKHNVYGRPRIKTIKGRKYLYCHHWWLKQSVDCYLGPSFKAEK